MKKKIGELTLAEIKAICSKHAACRYCPFRQKEPVFDYSYSGDPCILDNMLDQPHLMDVDKEIEIEEEAKC